MKKLESNGQHFKNMTELTEFIKENNTTISKPVTKKTNTYTYVSINNNLFKSNGLIKLLIFWENLFL